MSETPKYRVDLSVIIISFNTKKMTLDCIKSVYEQTSDQSFEIIVLDNDSKDGSAIAIDKEFPQVKLIKSIENIGFAAGNNIASQLAEGKYLLLLNPDTIILDSAIDKLYKFAITWPKEGIFGGRTFLGNGDFDPTSCWRKPSLWSVFCFGVGLTSLFNRHVIFDPESYGSWNRDSIRDVDIVTGCFLLLGSDTWRKLGGFSADFFMYAEEADLCLRAKKIQVQPILCPDAEIIHFGGASEKVGADKMVKMLKAKLTLLRKHWDSPLALFCAEKLYVVGALFRSLPSIHISNSSQKIKQWREIFSRRNEWTQK